MDKGVELFLKDIKEARLKRELILEDVVAACGSSVSNICALESRLQEPRLGLALKLAKFYKLDLTKYYNEESKDAPQIQYNARPYQAW